MSDIRGIPTQQFRPPKIPMRSIAMGVLVVLVLAFGSTMVFQVEPEEVAVVLTFGKFTSEAKPGLRFKLPAPIQTKIKVPVQRQLKLEFGFRTEVPGTRTRYSTASFEGESLMLTGDLNVAEVEWITQYRIEDPYKFLFKVDRVTETFRDMNEAVMRDVVGDRSVTEVLTIGRQEIASEVENRLQVLCKQYDTGIKIDQIVLQDVNPPDKVKPSFNEVNQAQQEKERMINEARSEFNKVVPRAAGEAQQIIQEAEGYATDRVNRARGDAALFTAVRQAYQRAPEVTRRRIYLETMQGVMPRIKRKIVIDDDLKGLIPLLSLDKAVQK
ncbi:MAG: FtsH protease activity modulator HflK [bacterium]|nr:FtsH protease activity modulator HflK [bacterium]